MKNISMDYNKKTNTVVLKGDISALKANRFAWRYLKDYFNPILTDNEMYIFVGDRDTVEILSNIRGMLVKYGFNEEQSPSSEKILLDFYKEEEKFKEFSKKAFDIRNNNCTKADFKIFSECIEKRITHRSLYPLQMLSAYHLAFAQNACNFSVPGAGKTSIVYGAYAFLNSFMDDHPKYINKLLIVGPLSSFGPWELEYSECFGKQPNVKRLSSGISRDEKIAYLHSKYTAEITLISYASLSSFIDELKFFLRNNKVMMVLDEAHKAKNTSGGITAEAVLDLSNNCSARVVLTGTPAPNGYEDLYNMFKFIWPNKNIIGFQVNQLKDMSSRNNESRVDRLINNISPFFIRIKKSDLNIPSATINPRIEVDMGLVQKRIYDFIEQKYIDSIINDKSLDVSSRFKSLLAQAKVLRLMQAATNPSMLKVPLKEFFEEEYYPEEAYEAINDSNVLQEIITYESREIPSKYNATLEIIKKLLDAGEKVIVWATFIHTIEEFGNYLLEHGIASQKLYGAIPVEKDKIEEEISDNIITREKIIAEFNKDSCEYKVLIANPHAIAESISLHKACHNAIYIERSFNAAHFVQSKDRIHRYGLKPGTKTNYYFIVSKYTIDETIDERLRKKEIRMTEIMESMPIPLFDNISSELGDEDIKALIKDYVKRTKKN